MNLCPHEDGSWYGNEYGSRRYSSSGLLVRGILHKARFFGSTRTCQRGRGNSPDKKFNEYLYYSYNKPHESSCTFGGAITWTGSQKENFFHVDFHVALFNDILRTSLLILLRSLSLLSHVLLFQCSVFGLSGREDAFSSSFLSVRRF